MRDHWETLYCFFKTQEKIKRNEKIELEQNKIKLKKFQEEQKSKQFAKGFEQLLNYNNLRAYKDINIDKLDIISNVEYFAKNIGKIHLKYYDQVNKICNNRYYKNVLNVEQINELFLVVEKDYTNEFCEELNRIINYIEKIKNAKNRSVSDKELIEINEYAFRLVIKAFKDNLKSIQYQINKKLLPKIEVDEE